MFRMWCKIFKENRLLRDTVIEDDTPDKSRTAKVLSALEEACREFDLAVSIWLDTTIDAFRRHDKARFYQDNFIETVILTTWKST